MGFKTYRVTKVTNYGIDYRLVDVLIPMAACVVFDTTRYTNSTARVTETFLPLSLKLDDMKLIYNRLVLLDAPSCDTLMDPSERTTEVGG